MEKDYQVIVRSHGFSVIAGKGPRALDPRKGAALSPAQAITTAPADGAAEALLGVADITWCQFRDLARTSSTSYASGHALRTC